MLVSPKKQGGLKGLKNLQCLSDLVVLLYLLFNQNPDAYVYLLFKTSTSTVTVIQNYILYLI